MCAGSPETDLSPRSGVRGGWVCWSRRCTSRSRVWGRFRRRLIVFVGGGGVARGAGQRFWAGWRSRRAPRVCDRSLSVVRPVQQSRGRPRRRVRQAGQVSRRLDGPGSCHGGARAGSTGQEDRTTAASRGARGRRMAAATSTARRRRNNENRRACQAVEGSKLSNRRMPQKPRVAS